jgi:hypothetical protein
MLLIRAMMCRLVAYNAGSSTEYIYIISTLAKIAKFHSSRCKIGKPGAATVTSCYFEAEE